MIRNVAVVIATVALSILFVGSVHAQAPDVGFVADVTVPDDTQLQPGEVFTKTWTLKNTGGVDWIDYSLQFVSGNKMDGVPAAIAPCKTNGLVDVSVVFTAPKDNGKHESWWRVVDEKGGPVGDGFYTRIVVGSGSAPEPTPVPGPDTSKMIQMNQEFTVNGFTFRVRDLWRNKAVYQATDDPVIARGVYAIARLEVTSHVPYTCRLTDNVLIVFTDDPGAVYRASYEPLTIARSAQLAATRHFENCVTVWTDMQPTFVNLPLVHTEDVPDTLQRLYLEVIDRSDNSGHWVHLQPLVSKDDMRYEGEFVNAPERKYVFPPTISSPQCCSAQLKWIAWEQSESSDVKQVHRLSC